MASTWTPPGWSWSVNDTRFKWSHRFTWLPKRSEQSGQLLWFTKAWYGYRWIDGPAGEAPLKSEQWLTDEEYVWYKLSSQ